jgi:hypothetical protein
VADFRMDHYREQPECPDHAGQPADGCEDCADREHCDLCGGSRVVVFQPPGRPYTVMVICSCDEHPAAVAAE